MADLTLNQMAFLDALAVGEDNNPADYDELCGGGKIANLSFFPEWDGIRIGGLMTHAAGRYQFEPATWKDIAARYNIATFMPYDQDYAAWNLAAENYHARTGRYLSNDLDAKILAYIPTLQKTWTSVNASTGQRYLGARAARMVIEAQGQTPAYA